MSTASTKRLLDKIAKLEAELENQKAEASLEVIKNFLQIQKLTAALIEVRHVMKAINDEELNSQRPGGTYSKSARLSYEALTKLNAILNPDKKD